MKKVILCACIVLLALLGKAYAEDQSRSDEIEALRRTVEEQNRTISQLLRRLEALEATQDEQAGWIEEKKEEKPLWTEHVKLKGDLRYRYEYIDDDRKTDERHRNRIRARLGVDAQALPTVDLHFQLSTAEVVDANGHDEGDPVSGNQTLTNAWSLKHIWLSQAYFDWHPDAAPGLKILGGKMHRPFITPVSSELIWDSDVNPEGGAIEYHKDFDPVELFARGYGFWVIERSAAADSALWGAQGALKYNFTAFDDKAHVMGGLSYYDYSNVEGRPFFVDGDSFGNTEGPVAGTFGEDFNLFEVFGEAGFRVKGMPVTAFADYVRNNAASSQDTGWSAGFKIGKASDLGSWEFRYLYKKVEQDAVFGTFTDSDFGGGGTDVEGHEINLAYQLAKNWQMAASYFINDVDVNKKPKEDYQRLQLDVIFKF